MAVGLPELITHTLEEYEAKALELLRAPEKLAELQERLAQRRLTSSLFDTARQARATTARSSSGPTPRRRW